ncbi:SUN domain-containing protein 1 [Nicotiana tabacum]|uniref:Protein SAD1/UNC-84 domain protein 1 n=1 Tax=Nicotiana tabacum TaxID=4097 RepID=A0A1S4D452_TOBAC|nr:PREDICTED: protein SAD1/UNC-84 domain protein 1-like [Nicotiana tabacum]
MSASTVSITANPASGSTRRRAVEKKQPSALDLADSNLATAAAAAAADPISTPNISFRSDGRDAIQVVKKPLPNTNAPTSSTRRASGSAAAAAAKKPSKPPKPRWLTVVSVFTKNLLLLLVLVGLIQMVRRLVMNSNNVNDSDGLAVISGDFEGKFAEMESFVKKTTKMMQVQIEVIDQKLDSGIRNVRDELSVKVHEKGEELELKLKEVSGRSENLEKLMNEFREKDWVSKDELNNLFEEYRKTKGDTEVDDKSLDEFRAYAREVVEKEIEKHAADGLGRVDYALASGGARVVKHSEPFITKSGGGDVWSLLNRNAVSNDAQKILTPSFGEPGQCFPLKGDRGFVQIRLRTPIIPEAVTLEHVAKSVAYDRSSAPKNCRISGWLHDKKETDLAADSEKMFLLTEFIYDLDKSNAQTFSVLESVGSSVVDTIRFDFTSNHGIPHTCIYRLRVHGREPNSLVMQS